MGIFHRYKSTIHGNYRRAYLRSGLLTGVLLALYILVRLLMGNAVESPVSLVADVILLVLVVLLTARYRNSLPEKRITLKEAMLFGMGTALVAGVVYGLLLYALLMASDQQTVLFTNTMLGEDTVDCQNPQLHYWAAWWAIVAGVGAMLLGAFGAFLASIFFRNEKSEIKHKQR